MAKKSKSAWGLRAQQAGITQPTIAVLSGRDETSVSRGLKGWASGVPGYLISIILAWEIMTPRQRARWLADTAAAQTRDTQEPHNE